MNSSGYAWRLQRFATIAALLAFPLASQAGNPQVQVSVVNLTNNLVSYSSASADLQNAYAAFQVRVANATQSSTTSYFRMQSLSSGQTSTSGFYPTFLAAELPSGCVPDATVPPSGSAVLCTWNLAPGEVRDFRVRVQTPQAPVGFSGTDYLFAKYSLQAGQGGANDSNLVYAFSDKSTLVVQTSREIHSFVEQGADLFVYVDQGKTDVTVPRPVLVGLNQSINKQSCSPQVKKCLISTVTIVNTSQSTEQFYDANWADTGPDTGWLRISLTRDASTINKKANINNATVRYSKDGVNFIDVYDCSTIGGVPQSYAGGVDAAGHPITNIGPNTHCIDGRSVNGDGSWTLKLVASENGKTSW